MQKSACFAGRFAAKEAVYKALSIDSDSLPNWKVIEILSERDMPTVRLSGRIKEHADNAGIKNILVSISHEYDYAVANAICI